MGMQKKNRSSWHRPILAAICALVASGFVAGCVLVDSFPGIRIWNRTDGRITVTYLLPNGDPDTLFGEIDLAPGDSTLETGVFRGRAKDAGCLRGTLVAERDGQRIAILPRPCEDTIWEVREPGTSESPAPSP